jgi:glycosyltransferase involved in cell wall biosynthesis
MLMRRLAVRAVGIAWDLSPSWRRPLRAARRIASLLRHRIRSLRLGDRAPVRVLHPPSTEPPARFTSPAVGVTFGPGVAAAERDALAARQTEPTVSADATAATPPLLIHLDEAPAHLPATAFEAHVLVHAALAPAWTAAGWMAPGPDPGLPTGDVRAFGDPDAAYLALRSPTADATAPSPVVGRTIGHVAAAERVGRLAAVEIPLTRAAGPSRLRTDLRPGAVVRQPVSPVDRVLADLPPVDGPRTALMLLPSLAVGGAERLLYDLLARLVPRFRILVATVEPHTEALGQTVDRCRELTPHVYTLGDWLPREAHRSALLHLLRRWRVECLVSWNGTVLFYDLAPGLAARAPRPRIIAQLFDHRGGWTAHHGPRLARSVDVHLAVNTPIARTLERDHGVPPERIATVHHGVPLPEAPSADERRRRRRERRDELGIPHDAVVVGTFIRMHRQKRPLDVVRLARRLERDGFHFLLAGGGPLDRRVDAEIARLRPPNVTRLPMRPDPERLYDAIDLCLMTSSYEGLPVFLLDGLARGLPAVAPAVGDVPLLLAGGGGLVVRQPGDLDGLAAALRALADPEVRRVAGVRGRDTVAERFSVDRFVRECEEVIFPP